MLKYVILIIVIYGIYRFSNAPKIGPTSKEQEDQEDEYTDYEEVE